MEEVVVGVLCSSVPGTGPVTCCNYSENSLEEVAYLQSTIQGKTMFPML